MKNLIFLAAILPALLLSQGQIDAFGKRILYEIPDSSKWKVDQTVFMESMQRGMISYKHIPIKDPLGRDIEPVIGMIYEKLPSDSIDPILYSANKRAASKGFDVDKVFGPGDLKLKYDRIIGYYGHYDAGVIHNLIIAHMVYKDIGVQIICDSTDGVYDQVKEDMELFICSVQFE